MNTYVLSLLAVISTARVYDQSAVQYNQYHPKPAYGSYSGIPKASKYYPKYPSIGHPKGEKEEAAAPQPYNPWENPESAPVEQDAVDKTGWYSPSMQYSPPKIAFKPTASFPVFGICQIEGSTILNGNFQFAQLPDKATLYQANFESSTQGQEFQIQIKTVGKIGSGEGMSCLSENTGLEFNPLEEIDIYGIRNPYQDPSRGRIDNLKAPEAATTISVEPTFVLQNMLGKDGILGRAITVQDIVTQTNIACCVIAIDDTPTKFKPEPTYPSQ